MKTKIIATIGPASGNYETITRMVEEGVAGFRINFAHGNPDVWLEYVDMVRKAEEKLGKPLTIIGDLRGPSIRLGELDQPLILKKGEIAIITPKNTGSAKEREIPLPSMKVFRELEVGDIIVMDDGRVKLKVMDVRSNELEVMALTDAVIKSRKAVIVMNKDFELPSLTSKDVADINFALKHDFDYIALSYVRTSKDLQILRDMLESKGYLDVGIIAKIETRASIENLDEIIEATDVVLVARGDLGMNFGLEEIPHLQKLIVRKSLEHGKPVIVATQLLESMIENPVPTRAEIVDITMAVCEGVDALMLTGETAIGNYPVDAVKWLRKTIEVAESRVEIQRIRKPKDVKMRFAKGIAELAEDLQAKLIIYSKKGKTAKTISILRPTIDFYTGTPSIRTLRKINILWGIKSCLVKAETYEEGLEETYKKLKELNEIRIGDLVILTYGLREEEQIIKVRKVTS